MLHNLTISNFRSKAKKPSSIDILLQRSKNRIVEDSTKIVFTLLENYFLILSIVHETFRFHINKQSLLANPYI